MEFESMLDIAKNNNIEYLDTAFEYKNVHKKLGQHNLDCFIMEFDPIYCDIIIKRWENFTGLKAELENGQN